VHDEFPDDDNGNVLRDMANRGDDLSKSRDIDFAVTFDNEIMAGRFLEVSLRVGLRSELDESIEVPGTWDVIITSYMTPTHDAISQMEDRLAKLSVPFGGRNDGWGCFNIPKNDSGVTN
jgi:hypothetical protein